MAPADVGSAGDVFRGVGGDTGHRHPPPSGVDPVGPYGKECRGDVDANGGGNVPVAFGAVRTILVVAFREPTPSQAAFLQQSGPPLSGPITWIADVWSAGPHASLSTAVADLIAAVNSQGSRRVPIRPRLGDAPAVSSGISDVRRPS